MEHAFLRGTNRDIGPLGHLTQGFSCWYRLAPALIIHPALRLLSPVVCNQLLPCRGTRNTVLSQWRALLQASH